MIARTWYDTNNVDAIVDVPTSSVALAVQQITREKNRVFLISGAGASDLTGSACSPNGIHWTYDTYALSNVAGKAMVARGEDTWFFLTADYAFGLALERDAANVVKVSGGKVLGVARAPLNTQDFSSFLLQAQTSRAKVVALANAGGDTQNAIKQAYEFGLQQQGQKLLALLLNITDVHSLGVQAAQGMIATEGFYWDMDDASRAFSKRFFQKEGHMPTMIQAGVYSRRRSHGPRYVPGSGQVAGRVQERVGHLQSASHRPRRRCLSTPHGRRMLAGKESLEPT